MKTKLWMQIKLGMSQLFLVSSPIVAAMLGYTGWALAFTFGAMLWGAMWYNKHIAVEFFDVGEHVGKLLRGSKLIVIDNKGNKLENFVIIVIDADNETVVEDATLTFE